MSGIKITKRMTVYFFLMLAVMAAIFAFSAQNSDSSADLSHAFANSAMGQLLMRFLPRIFSNDFMIEVRKYAHVFEYLLLGISAALLMRELSEDRALKAGLSAELLCLLYAASDEWHQSFVPGRACRLSDVGVDSIGFTAGIILILLAASFFKKNKKRS